MQGRHLAMRESNSSRCFLNSSINLYHPFCRSFCPSSSTRWREQPCTSPSQEVRVAWSTAGGFSGLGGYAATTPLLLNKIDSSEVLTPGYLPLQPSLLSALKNRLRNCAHTMTKLLLPCYKKIKGKTTRSLFPRYAFWLHKSIKQRKTDLKWGRKA